MSTEILSALIAALVALITAAISGFITWSQVQRERTKWLVDLKTAYNVELYKARLAEYPKLLHVLEKLSTRAAIPMTPETSQKIANEINDWFYSAGGLCADASTRGALLGLRESLLQWREGPLPPEIRQWRNAVVFSLRRDLDVMGLESFNPDDTAPLLEKLKKEMESVSK